MAKNLIKHYTFQASGQCPGPKRALLKPKMAFLEHKRAFFKHKMAFFRQKRTFWTRKGFLSRQRRTFSASKRVLLGTKVSILSPRALSKQTKARSETKRDPLEQKKTFEVERSLLEPEWAHLNQANSFSDSKRANWRPKMVLWKRIKFFSKSKGLFWSKKKPFRCQKFSKRAKRA